MQTQTINEVRINGWRYSHETPRGLKVYRHESGAIAREVKSGGKVKVFGADRTYMGWSPDIATEVKKWSYTPQEDEQHGD